MKRSFLLVVLLVISTRAWIKIGPATNPITASAQEKLLIDDLVANMRNRWIALDAQCDSKAPFALTYLIMTEHIQDAIENNYFKRNDDMVSFTLLFAQRYLDAIDNWFNNTGVTAPWQEAFQWGESGGSSVTQDLFLGMNAHINYDLALVTYQLGWAQLGLLSPFKADYDRVNDILRDAQSVVSQGLYNYYDPSFAPGSVNDFGSPLVLEMIIQWRNGAFLNAIAIETAILKEAELTRIEIAAVLIAKTFQLPNPPSTIDERLQYCLDNPQ